jgi:ribulose-phosphate 3-epimerase
MLRCSTSLWSADLGNLAAEMRRIEPYTERWHIDVADGHYVPTLLFFPDLVRSLRPHTQKPFEIHLLVNDPDAWIEPFVESGADGFILCRDSREDLGPALDAIERAGKYAGISLTLEESLDRLEPYGARLSVITLVGTPMGIKGATGSDPSVPGKIERARSWLAERRFSCEIEIDGGIRRHTVPDFARAGADWIVPGSLMFGSDPREMRQWLATL